MDGWRTGERNFGPPDDGEEERIYHRPLSFAIAEISFCLIQLFNVSWTLATTAKKTKEQKFSGTVP